MTSYSDLTNFINEKIYDAWIAEYQNATDLTLPSSNLKDILFYQGLDAIERPNNNYFWGRVSFISVDAKGKTMVNSSDKRLFEDIGIVIIQIFCPMNIVNSWTKGKNLAIITRDALRSRTNCNDITIKNQKIVPLSPEQDFLRYNVNAEYKFYEKV